MLIEENYGTKSPWTCLHGYRGCQPSTYVCGHVTACWSCVSPFSLQSCLHHHPQLSFMCSICSFYLVSCLRCNYTCTYNFLHLLHATLFVKWTSLFSFCFSARNRSEHQHCTWKSSITVIRPHQCQLCNWWEYIYMYTHHRWFRKRRVVGRPRGGAGDQQCAPWLR